MASVFVLQHVHTREDGGEDVKFLGVYSSREKADAAVAPWVACPASRRYRTGSTSMSTESIRTTGLRGTL